jgi:hypothetical protein
MLKTQKGITLISLIVTIVIILILAGITLSTVVGENGILSKSKVAVTKNREVSAKEEVSMAWTTCEMAYQEAWTSNQSVQRRSYYTQENMNNAVSSTGEVIAFTYNEGGESEIKYKSNDQGIVYLFKIDTMGNIRTVDDITLNASTIQPSEFGQIVTNYTDGDQIWEIFYADSTNIFLITHDVTGYVHLSSWADGFSVAELNNYNGTDDFTEDNLNNKFKAVADGWFYATYKPGDSTPLKYSSSYQNMKAAEYLLDSTQWTTYSTNSHAKWAIGGPTLELLLASYDAVNTSTHIISDISGTGYPPMLNSGLSNGTVWNRGTNYWLACPSNIGGEELVRYVYSFGEKVDYVWYYSYEFGLRPVVCLNSDVVMIKNADGTVTIDE